LIRESLDLAKLEGRRAHPATEVCEISGIVDRVTARMTRQSGSRKFIIEIPEDLPPITGDSFLLEQMLLQVVDNAWKYSRPGTPIRISCVLSAGNIVLTVCNEGSEIPEEERERIFDKFYRGSRDRGVVEGTGMGLVIARTIAEAYQGKIWLDNEPEGPAFRFALPYEATEEFHDREPHHITH
jgi:two-component system sensor histidine kinase KdpD